jgi:hypothetical protein
MGLRMFVFFLRFLWLRYPLALVEQPGRLLESLHTKSVLTPVVPGEGAGEAKHIRALNNEHM